MNKLETLSETEAVIGNTDRIDLIIVRLPFIKPFATSTYTWNVKEALLVKISAGDCTGWGECVADPDPFYSPETTVSARYIIKDFLIPGIEGGVTLAEVEKRFQQVRGNSMAKAAVENALIDLLAKQNNVPLYQFLGFPARKIMSGVSIGLQNNIGDLIAAVEDARGKKYHRIKMKIKRGQDVAWVRAVREKFPDIMLMVDANGDYQLSDAAESLQQLDKFNLMMIEQPLSYFDIYQHSILQRALKTPLCLDESIHSLDDAAAAIALDSCRILNIKQGRVGGLLESRRMARFAADHHIGVWSGGMDETGIGRAVNIHLQADKNFNLPGDTSETSRYFHEDIVEPPVLLDSNGFIDIPAGSGSGVKILPKLLAKYTIHQERIK